MPSHVGRDRPSGVRGGVGDKPPRVPTVVLDGADPAIIWGSGNVVRIVVNATASGNAVVRHGRYDGQVVLLLTVVNNGGSVTLPDDTASNVDLGSAYDFTVNSVLMLVWDARQLLWIESPRGVVGATGATGADGEDFVDLDEWDSGYVLATLIRALITQGIDPDQPAREFMERRL